LYQILSISIPKMKLRYTKCYHKKFKPRSNRSCTRFCECLRRGFSVYSVLAATQEAEKLLQKQKRKATEETHTHQSSKSSPKPCIN
ncbi:hypothetical protein VIGAN_09198700, partial [Vigna angularis var. angularis]